MWVVHTFTYRLFLTVLGNSITDYARAVGKNEIQWTEEHAQPRMNFQRSPEEPETPSDYISLLQRYTKLAPFLVPPSSGSERLNHYNLTP